jgi:glycine dehydrogenase
MALMMRVSKSAGATTFMVSDRTFPHVLDVILARAKPMGISVQVVDARTATIDAHVFGVYLQSPDDHGEVTDLGPVIDRAHAAGALVAVGTDLLALTLMKAPGESGADVVVGNAQRFGVPLGYGGPHAAFFATRDASSACP